jgi:hypothetical protein
MTVYGGKVDRFRPAPTATSLALSGAGFAVTTAAITAGVSALADLFLAWIAGWPGPAALYAPAGGLVQGALFSSPPLGTSYQLAPLLVPAACAMIALSLIYFWPTAQRLSSRLFIHHLALMLGTMGVAAPLLEPSTLEQVRELTNAAPHYASAFFCLAAAGIVVVAERRSLQLLANVFPDPATAERLNLWMLRMPIGLVMVALLAIANHHFAAVWALAGAALISIFLSLLRWPRPHYEKAAMPQMKGAAILLPIVAAVLAAASAYLFGMPAAGVRPHALVLSVSGVAIEPLRLVAPSGPFRVSGAAAEPSPSPTPEEKQIDIRWSR